MHEAVFRDDYAVSVAMILSASRAVQLVITTSKDRRSFQFQEHQLFLFVSGVFKERTRLREEEKDKKKGCEYLRQRRSNFNCTCARVLCVCSCVIRIAWVVLLLISSIRLFLSKIYANNRTLRTMIHVQAHIGVSHSRRARRV